MLATVAQSMLHFAQPARYVRMIKITQFNRQRGASVFELAVAIPLFSLILFGILQWGHILTAYIAVRNAATLGARDASLWRGPNVPPDYAAAQTATINSLANVLKTDTDSCPTTGNPLCAECRDMSGSFGCTVTYRLKLFAPFVVPNRVNGRYVLQATARTR